MIASSFTGTKVNLSAIGVCKKSLYVMSPALDIADASSIPIDAKYVLNLLEQWLFYTMAFAPHNGIVWCKLILYVFVVRPLWLSALHLWSRLYFEQVQVCMQNVRLTPSSASLF